MFPAALLYPMLIGGGLGALTSKKPLQGALLGAGMGALGGAVAPGMGGLFGGTPFNPAAASGMTNGAFLGEGVASGVGALDKAASGGLLGTLKEFGPAAGQLANSGLLDSQDPQIQPPAPMQQAGGGSQILSAIAQQGEQNAQAQLAQDAQIRRKRRMGLLGDVA
jgi:hypothetical protein